MSSDMRLVAERARNRSDQQAAARYVLSRALNPDDAQTLLQMLGLDLAGEAA